MAAPQSPKVRHNNRIAIHGVSSFVRTEFVSEFSERFNRHKRCLISRLPTQQPGAAIREAAASNSTNDQSRCPLHTAPSSDSAGLVSRRPRRSSSRARKTQTYRDFGFKKASAVAGIDRDCEPFHSVRPDICLSFKKLKIWGSQYWDVRQTICEPVGVISAAIVRLSRAPPPSLTAYTRCEKSIRTVTGLEDSFLAPCIGSSVYE